MMNLSDAQYVTFDREQAFLLYATFCGDLERTAHALNIRPIELLRAVDEENWNEKLKGILELKKSNRPGDIERAINRALNFVMAHRLRLFLERVLNKVVGLTDEELQEYLLTGRNAAGKFPTVSGRALADLATAIEKAHAMTYMALNDSAPERSKRKGETDDAGSGGELHVKISEAMANVRATRSPRGALLEAQIKAGDRAQAQQAKDSPYDKES